MADKEYIEREFAKQILETYMAKDVDSNKISNAVKKLYLIAKDHAKGYLSIIPAADVVEVRHGYWIRDKKSYFFHRYNCSVCGFRRIGEPTKFCEDCGAKMDKNETQYTII